MTNEPSAPSGANTTPGLPPVQIEIQGDFETDSRIARAYQRWIANPRLGSDPTTAAELPLTLYGKYIIPEQTAHEIIRRIMDAHAEHMIAHGYRPYVSPKMDDVIMGFGKPESTP